MFAGETLGAESTRPKATKATASAARPSLVTPRRRSTDWPTADLATRPNLDAPAEAAPPAVSAGVAPVASAAPLRWRTRYQRLVLLVDLFAAVVGAAAGLFGRYGTDLGEVSPVRLSLAGVLPLIWVGCIALNRAYDASTLGAGTAEYERIGRSFLYVVAVLTFAAFAAHVDLSRGFVLIALPVMLALTAAGRLAARKLLHRRRRTGRAMIPVLAVGSAVEIVRFSTTLAANGYAGLRVAGACLTPGRDGRRPAASGDHALLAEHGIADVGDVDGVDSIRAAVAASGAQTVAVVSGDLGAERLRWIAWQLEGTETDLVVVPGLTEVTGRRLSIQQVGALPLLHVAQPEFTGARRVIKTTFDKGLAAFALLLLSPLLLVVGAVVRATSSGPALFVQTRIGKDGKAFRMVKFRSMYRDAEARVAELAAANEADGGVLFKMREDPRVTRVGRVLRRYSLDELPQLLNVLTGSMSLVGPRPPLPREVATYGDDVHRRLLVKPGLTGLWQISGRSDLSWEESVRLDLRYVENWSLTLDLILLAKTVRAVGRPSGAY